MVAGVLELRPLVDYAGLDYIQVYLVLDWDK
jgi:hypothetical protein